MIEHPVAQTLGRLKDGQQIELQSRSLIACPPVLRWKAAPGQVSLDAPVPMNEIIDKKEARNRRRRSARDQLAAFTRAGCL